MYPIIQIYSAMSPFFQVLRPFPCCIEQFTRGWSQEDRAKYHQVWGLWPEQMSKRLSSQEDLKVGLTGSTRNVSSGTLCLCLSN